MTYRFIINAFTNCSTLLGNNHWKENKIYRYEIRHMDFFDTNFADHVLLWKIERNWNDNISQDDNENINTFLYGSTWEKFDQFSCYYQEILSCRSP